MEGDANGKFDIVAARKEHLEHPTNDYETMFNMIKGLMAIGLLAMPYGFKYCGLFAGLVGTVFVSLLAGYGIFLMVHSAHEIYRRLSVPFLSYAQMVQKAFELGPEKLRVLSKAGAIMIDILLSLNMIGCCVAYTIFFAETVKQIVDVHQPDARNYFGVRWYIAFFLVPLIFLVLIRHLKYLSYISLTANLFMLFGIACSIYYLLRSPIKPISSRPYIVSVTNYPVFFSISLFAMECMAVIMSLENNMGNPRHMITIPGLICIAFSFACVLFSLVGFTGFLEFGDDIKANFVLNLPSEEILAQIAKLTVALGIFLTFILQFYVPIEIMIKYLENRFGKMKIKWVFCLRELTCIVTVFIAWVLPTIGGIIGLIGAVACSLLGLVFPAILDLLLFYNYSKCMILRYIVDFFIIIFGIFMLISGAYLSILEIIADVTFEF